MKKQKFTIMTLTVPKVNPVSNFRISNTSSFYTDKPEIYVQNFLIQMLKLNLYRFKIIYIWDDKNLFTGKKIWSI